MKFILLFLFTFNLFAATTAHKTDKLKLGRNIGEDIFIFADTGTTSLPYIFYDFSAGVWKQSNDGITSEVIGGASVITTQGDLIIGNVSGVDSRLAIGTNGQLLTSNGTTASWQDAPISTTLDTKGDIQTYSTQNAKLAVGSDGSMLVADSAEATGLKWSDQLQGLLNPVADWTNGTCASSWSAFGTIACKYMRIGDTAVIQFFVKLTTSTSGALTFEMPSGLSVDESKLVSTLSHIDGNGSNLDFGVANYHGLLNYDTSTNNFRARVYNGNVAYSGLVSVTNTVPFTWDSQDEAQYTITVPILGWSSGTNAVARNKVLRKVLVGKTDAQSLARGASTTIIFNNEIEDTHNLYNPSTGVFTCPEVGAKFVISARNKIDGLDDNSASSFQTFITRTSGGIIALDAKNYLPTGVVSADFVSTPPYIECLSNGEQFEFKFYCGNVAVQNCSTRAQSGSNYYSEISFTELADSAVIAGTFGKCQTKFLSADVTTDTTNIADLRFNNLTIGQRYKVCANLNTTFPSGEDNISLDAIHNSGTIISLITSGSTSGLKEHYECNSFVSSTSTLTFNAGSITAGNSIRGNGGIGETYAILCTDNTETTTEWN